MTICILISVLNLITCMKMKIQINVTERLLLLYTPEYNTFLKLIIMQYTCMKTIRIFFFIY